MVTARSVPATLVVPLTKSSDTSVTVSSACWILFGGCFTLISLHTGKGKFSDGLVTAIDIIALLTIMTLVDELIGGSALALVFTLDIALLLTGPLTATVIVVTAG